VQVKYSKNKKIFSCRVSYSVTPPIFTPKNRLFCVLLSDFFIMCAIRGSYSCFSFSYLRTSLAPVRRSLDEDGTAAVHRFVFCLPSSVLCILAFFGLPCYILSKKNGLYPLHNRRTFITYFLTRLSLCREENASQGRPRSRELLLRIRRTVPRMGSLHEMVPPHLCRRLHRRPPSFPRPRILTACFPRPCTYLFNMPAYLVFLFLDGLNNI